MSTLLEMLAGGDRRTLGRSAEVANRVLARPELVSELFDGIASGDEVIRGRASDALEKVSAERPDLIQPYQREILDHLTAVDDWVVREHVCLILPRLTTITAADRRRTLATVRGYLNNRSSIVQAFALECLVRLSRAPGFERERMRVDALVERCVTQGATPAVRARARRMMKMISH
ncbi:MAG TPA: hypothetical protein DCQ94_16410 [Nitrospira sp.]|nr:hypothetical protein [Nitrospira sp.]HRJ46475.1 hypothetical protein [Opitutaceae bacterium]